MTTAELTKQAIKMLEARNCNVWRVNNVPVRRRKGTVKKGKSDIQGFHNATGIYVACEVKNEGDALSVEQQEFLRDVKNAGGIAIVATCYYNEVFLNEYIFIEPKK